MNPPDLTKPRPAKAKRAARAAKAPKGRPTASTAHPLPISAQTTVAGVDPRAVDQTPVSLQHVENMLTPGLLKPEDVVASFAQLELSPGIYIDSSAVRWSPLLKELLYHKPNGRVQRLGPLSRYLLLGGTADAWAPVEPDELVFDPRLHLLAPIPANAPIAATPTPPAANPASAASNAPASNAASSRNPATSNAPASPASSRTPAAHNPATAERPYYKRFVLELETLLVISRQETTLMDHGVLPNDIFRIVDFGGRWQLIDRSTGMPSVFSKLQRAIEAVETALVGDLGQHVFIDRFNALDPDPVPDPVPDSSSE